MSATIRCASLYLVVSPKGYGGLCARLTTRAPRLERDEIALSLSVNVPDALFSKPQLRATITIPVDKVTPTTLAADVLDNVRETLSKATGFDVTVRLVEPE